MAGVQLYEIIISFISMHNHFSNHTGLAGSKIQPYLRARKMRRKVLKVIAVGAFVLIMATIAVGVVLIAETLIQPVEEVYAWQPPVTEMAISIEATVTAYSSSEDETDDRPWEMASGRTVYEGAIACPSRFEFGTRIVIDETIYTCEDRMNKRYRDGNYFDIWMGSKVDALKYGKQTLSVLVLL